MVRGQLARQAGPPCNSLSPKHPPPRTNTNRQGAGPATDFGSVFRSFSSISRQEVLLTLGVGGVILVGATVLEPMLASFWERQNKGKLFSHMEKDLLKAQREELARLRAARLASASQPRPAASAPASAPAAALPAAAATVVEGGLAAAPAAVAAEAAGGGSVATLTAATGAL